MGVEKLQLWDVGVDWSTYLIMVSGYTTFDYGGGGQTKKSDHYSGGWRYVQIYKIMGDGVPINSNCKIMGRGVQTNSNCGEKEGAAPKMSPSTFFNGITINSKIVCYVFVGNLKFMPNIPQSNRLIKQVLKVFYFCFTQFAYPIRICHLLPYFVYLSGVVPGPSFT